jgi:hypothetical protein
MTQIEKRRSEIVVGLVATPPDYPARVAGRLTAELAGQLAERVDVDVRWTVREGWGEVAPRRDGGVEALLDDLARRRANARWDVAICLTDLPLHTERVPLVAQAGRWAPAELASRVAAIRRVVGKPDAGELGYVASRLIGRMRLLTGMVRANRPARPAGPVQAAGRRVRYGRGRPHHEHYLADGRCARRTPPGESFALAATTALAISKSEVRAASIDRDVRGVHAGATGRPTVDWRRMLCPLLTTTPPVRSRPHER